MSEIKGLKKFDTEPTNFETQKIDELINEPLSKDLVDICKLLSKD
jgi:hypothetical protein